MKQATWFGRKLPCLPRLRESALQQAGRPGVLLPMTSNKLKSKSRLLTIRRGPQQRLRRWLRLWRRRVLWLREGSWVYLGRAWRHTGETAASVTFAVRQSQEVLLDLSTPSAPVERSLAGCTRSVSIILAKMAVKIRFPFSERLRKVL